jgi:transposase
MPAAVTLRDDYSAKALRALARRSKDVNQSRRLLSLAAVRDGMDRGSAAKIGGMDRQTLRDWVHRFNALGPNGLIDTRTEGRKSRLSAEQMAAFAQIVEAGPDRERDGVVRWRRIDLKRVIGEKFRRRLPSALCRETPQESRLLAHQRTASPSEPGRADRRGVQKRMARPSASGLSRLAADPVCFNVSGLEELPPATMEIRTLGSS